MICTEFFRRARAYMEKQLPEDELAACAEHERTCDSCSRVMQVARETTCHGLTCFLDDYVAGTLPTAQRDVFERHLALCSECHDYLDSYRTTVELARRVTCEPEAEPESECGLPEGLVQAILAARTSASDAD